MKRHYVAMAASVLAFAAAPSTALAGGGSLGGLVKQTQTATNSNETNQTAKSTATSEQLNVNAPISIASEGSNNGDVNQSNEGDTRSSAQNDNNTEQGNRQNQEGSASGQGGDGKDCGCSSKGGQKVDQSQTGENSNETNQTAESSATNKQTNVNVPIAILSKDSNNGNVNQSNESHTRSSAQNDNNTEQGNRQNQKGSASGKSGHGKDCGCDSRSHKDGGSKVDQSQTGENSNTTNQTAESSATNQQENINAPFSKGGKGSKGSDCGCESRRHKDGGDVNQSNDADTSSSAKNNNNTEQGNRQNQKGSASGKSGHGKDCGCDSRSHKDGGSKVDQTQTAKNSNETNQTADSSASNQQENINAPYSEGGRGSKGSDCGCEEHSHKDGGDVNQSNDADTSSSAKNNNNTEQGNRQNQEGSAS